MKMNIRWGELVIQMFSVSFGVLFALLVNQAIETKRETQDLNLVLQGLSNEMRFNKSFLARKIGYYEKVVSEIDSLQRSGIKSIGVNNIPSWNGLQPPFLRRSSFDLGLSTGVFKNFDYSQADKISTLYAFQDFYVKMIDMFINKIMSDPTKPIKGGDGMGMNMIRGTFHEWIQIGNELTRSIDRILNTLPPPSESESKD